MLCLTYVWVALALAAPPVRWLPRSVAATGERVHVAAPRPDRVLVPAGSFRMGSTEEDLLAAERLCIRKGGPGPSCARTGFEDEMPMRIVRHPAYRIDRTEVTYSAHQRCVQAGVQPVSSFTDLTGSMVYTFGVLRFAVRRLGGRCPGPSGRCPDGGATRPGRVVVVVRDPRRHEPDVRVT